MPTEQLGEITLSYTVGALTYTRGDNLQWGNAHGNPYFVLTPNPAPLPGLNDAHITVWGDWTRYAEGVPIATVEYTWGGAKHLEFNVDTRRITAKQVGTDDMVTARALEDLLVQFLVGLQFVPGAGNVTSAFVRIAAAQERAVQQAINTGRKNTKKGTTTFSLTGGGRNNW